MWNPICKVCKTDHRIGAANHAFEPLSIFEQVKAAGIPYVSHESDLYIPVTGQTRAIVAVYRFRENVITFRNNLDNQLWYDVPFAYQPYWDRR